VLSANPDGSLQALLEDCADAATDVLVAEPIWSRMQFDAARERVARDLVSTAAGIVTRVEKVLAAAQDVRLLLPAQPSAAQAAAIADINAQLDRLLPRNFVTLTGAARLADLTRYLTAIGRRLDRLPHGIAADTDRMDRVHAVEVEYEQLVAALSSARAGADDIRDIGRQIEELRVSLWAQQLGTPRPVSEQRIYRAIDAVRP
jgi:ATP-dependent helicase HrpA